MAGHLIAETPADGVLLLRINRPERRNALTRQLVIDLAAALREAEASPAVRVAILTGDDIAFSAGADIHEINEKKFGAVLDDVRLAAWGAIQNFAKPLIAAIRGFAYGAGNELAMLCDIMIAGRGAKFSQPEVKLGGLAGDGGSQRLPRLVGRQAAARMLFTGAAITAAEAKDMGLVADVVEDAKVVETAVALAAKIAVNAPLSLIATKDLIRRCDEGRLSDGLRYERETLLRVFESEDYVEGMKAFAEKRPAVWKGK